MEWIPYKPDNHNIESFDLRDIFNELERTIFRFLDWELRSVDVVFQPIYRFPSFEVIGFEAFCRPRTKRHISELLGLAKKRGLLSEFDLFCRIKALLSALERGIREEELLFLNVHPEVLGKRSYPRGVTLKIVSLLGLKPSQVVMDITGFEQVKDPELYLRTVFHYSKQGFRVCLDDFESGCVGHRNLQELRPDFVKLDSSLLSHSLEERFLLRTIEHIRDLCEDINCEIVAKRVEGKDTLSLFLKAGVCIFQGDYLSPPSPYLNREGFRYEREDREATIRSGTNTSVLPYF